MMTLPSQLRLFLQCPKVRWSECKLCQKRIREENLPDEYCLQSWFIGRINTFLMQCGKRLIGWDEILEGGLNPGTMVMSWRVSLSAETPRACSPLCYTLSVNASSSTWAVKVKASCQILPRSRVCRPRHSSKWSISD